MTQSLPAAMTQTLSAAPRLCVICSAPVTSKVKATKTCGHRECCRQHQRNVHRARLDSPSVGAMSLSGATSPPDASAFSPGASAFSPGASMSSPGASAFQQPVPSPPAPRPVVTRRPNLPPLDPALIAALAEAQRSPSVRQAGQFALVRTMDGLDWRLAQNVAQADDVVWRMINTGTLETPAWKTTKHPLLGETRTPVSSELHKPLLGETRKTVSSRSRAA